ncbi:IS481 family transposase [Amycolatopsis sp. AA4]|uniref:IS481 family transposase n=1 Tax=Actinomycetes TaxID=1760 RepID=UPI0001B540A0|nr:MULTISPECIES: IS481 family transposase [Actinomycetes]ATY10831.1 IS481 family transposase [Amycolatopsis sp. AA4]ATY11324.1 IS481 family transposase [Amycolatopsis sp. AA4]ATY13237.1 IS481 family transposase [Amycolatopsis sp. AA4]ATY14435.1 IS481 family transposase [Amycolatopsis sp. AA4]
MDPEFVAAVAGAAAGEDVNIARFCREHGVSRTVFHKYLNRFRAEGADGFTRRSTAPHRRPTALGTEVAEAVLRARKELADEGLDNGPISIRWRLEAQGAAAVPSQSAVYRILRAHGQIVPQPRKKPRTRRRFEYADPNGCWQIDGMEHHLADGTKVCIIQILDDHSRLDVGAYAATGETTAATWAALQHAFAGHGLPVALLSDNGLAFSGKHRGRMVELERRLAALGITAIAAAPHHPQTCGKNERSHQTLQKWLAARPAAGTLAQLQELLDEYRTIYNHRRHQSLNGDTPRQRYDARPKAVPATGPRRPSGLATRPVSATGVIAFSGCSIVLGRRWAGHTASVYWQGDRVTVMINDTIARQLTLDRSVRYQRLANQKLPTKS